MPARGEPTIVFVQTVVPDYRTRFYEDLAREVGTYTLMAGGTDWSTDIVHVETVPSVHVRNRYLAGRRLLWQSGVLRAAASADVVITSLNPRVLSSWLILVIRRLRRRRTLLWGHAWPRRGRSDRARDVFRRLASTLIVYTETEARQLRELRRETDVVAAPNGLYRRAEIGPVHAGAACDVVFVGRLNPSKKPVLLLDAFVSAAPRLPADVRLVLVGDGPQRELLEQRANDADLGDRVVFTGHISDVEELRAIYGRAIVSVSPGYVGLSLIQSLGYGVPMLIARDEPHSPEIEALAEGENGSLFASDSPDSLAVALVEMVAKREHWLSRRGAIAEQVRSTYTVEHMVAAFASAIRGDRGARSISVNDVPR